MGSRALMAKGLVALKSSQEVDFLYFMINLFSAVSLAQTIDPIKEDKYNQQTILEKIMKYIVTLLFLLCFVFIFSKTSDSKEKAKFYDDNYNLKYRIEGDKIYTPDYQLKYRIDGKKIFDNNYNLKYRIEDNKIYGPNYQLKGRIENNKIYGPDYQLKGRIEK